MDRSQHVCGGDGDVPRDFSTLWIEQEDRTAPGNPRVHFIRNGFLQSGNPAGSEAQHEIALAIVDAVDDPRLEEPVRLVIDEQ